MRRIVLACALAALFVMLPEPLCRAAEGSAPSPAPPAASGAEADAYLRGYVES